MEVGIAGLPATGKTTLFNALTGSHAEAFSGKAHVGMAKIPDPRLAIIARYINPREIVQATLKLVDIPGVPASSDAKKLNMVFEKIREVEAICHVVRCFDDGSGVIDPAGDLEKMETEMVIADLIVAEGGKEKAAKPVRAGDKGAIARLALLEKIIPTLEAGSAIRSISDFTDEERMILKNYGFISAKPALYVANVGEDDLGGQSVHAEIVRKHAEAFDSQSVAVCALLEAELSELDEADRVEMLESMGLTEPIIGRLARAANTVLGMAIFYTAGEKQVRAWTFRRGALAPEVAGGVHSDMERGFIRAECYHIDDLVEHESERALRDVGKLRSEGKHYQIQDGDIVLFLFNV